MRVAFDDRTAIERLYPRDAFSQEAQANARGDAAVRHGLLICSAPDAAGGFELVRAARQVGEKDDDLNSLFLCPFAEAAPPTDRDAAYGAFIDQLITTARTARLDTAPGAGDPRLRGPRQ